VTIIPASFMVFCLIAIIINVQTRRNRVITIEQTNENQQERRRAHFLHRQMFILMFAALMLFFLTTCPIALFYFAIATLNIQQPFSFKLMLISILDFVTTLNYSLNFYLHCLTSKLFRKEFFQYFPCSISIAFRQSNQASNVTHTQRYLTR
ncbi:unnamed protein product, partial [Rotaria sp. Silwood1]